MGDKGRVSIKQMKKKNLGRNKKGEEEREVILIVFKKKEGRWRLIQKSTGVIVMVSVTYTLITHQ